MNNLKFGSWFMCTMCSSMKLLWMALFHERKTTSWQTEKWYTHTQKGVKIQIRRKNHSVCGMFTSQSEINVHTNNGIQKISSKAPKVEKRTYSIGWCAMRVLNFLLFSLYLLILGKFFLSRSIGVRQLLLFSIVLPTSLMAYFLLVLYDVCVYIWEASKKPPTSTKSNGTR